jgi:phosphocarrier protein HPr
MPSRDLTIVNKLGLHARPAAMFVRIASAHACEVWVEKDDEQVNGKSIMGLMMLAAGCGSTIKVTTEGSDEDEAMEKIVALIAGGFSEGS